MVVSKLFCQIDTINLDKSQWRAAQWEFCRNSSVKLVCWNLLACKLLCQTANVTPSTKKDLGDVQECLHNSTLFRPCSPRVCPWSSWQWLNIDHGLHNGECRCQNIKFTCVIFWEFFWVDKRMKKDEKRKKIFYRPLIKFYTNDDFF